MSDRYTDREQALVDYLAGVLSSTDYDVSRNSSVSLGTGEKPYVILVRWLGASLSADTTMEETDKHIFSVLCLPRTSDDDTMNTSCNLMVEQVADAIRSTSHYAVMGGLEGQPLGWKVVAIGKGKNEFSDVACELIIECEFQEDPAQTSLLQVLLWRERIGDTVTLEVEGLESAEFEWRLPDGSTSHETTLSYESSGGGFGRLVIVATAEDSMVSATATIEGGE